MKAKWFGLAVAAAVAAGGCGEGRAIFDVDVFSFLTGLAKDTVHYVLPPGLPSNTFDNTPIRVGLLPGLGSSTVDTVRITGTALLENVTGSGSIRFQIFFADSASKVYTGTPALSVPSTGTAPVTPNSSTPLPFDVPLLGLVKDLFKDSEVFIGVRVTASTGTGAFVEGRVRLTALRARIVLQDKIF